MGKIVTNLVIILGFITIAFVGYYVFIQKNGSVMEFNSNKQTMQNMLNNTQVFIARRQALDTVELTTAIQLFDDARFRSLRSFSTPIKERPVGRLNPFEPAAVPSNDDPSF